MSTLFVSQEVAFWLYPVYAICLSAYYYKATGEMRMWLVVMLLSSMLAEIFFQYNYAEFIDLVSLCSTVFYITIIYLLKTVISFNFKNFATHNLAEIFVGSAVIISVFLYCLIAVVPSIPDLVLFIPSLIAFCIVVIILYAIPQFNNNPSNLLLTFMATSLLLENLTAFIHKYINSEPIFLAVSIIFGAAAKIIFTMYLVRIQDREAMQQQYI